MTENEIQNAEPAATGRIPKRRSVVAALGVLAMLGIGVGGYVVHNNGVDEGWQHVRNLMIDASIIASASTPILDTGRSAGAGVCLSTVTIGDTVWVLPDHSGGAMRRPTDAEAKALAEGNACGGVTIPN
ncbi:Uncharacterised protein [Mycobacteroides abscessus subsp. abscessus]|uniref:hypothetical protein n=1 Tax=Mycobacteroides abscessus TaxID=36809 RepID=UPI0009A6E8F7|nr:hypothetical protein [Mycobacteroides abscessus]SKM35251.1 Uncharacterised protein [Mycobacteroides abscessus subsp. abscessus]